MPIYEYKCAKCGQTSEFLENLNQGKNKDRKCRSCGSTELSKIMSAGFVQSSNADSCDSCPVSTPCCSGGKCQH